MFCQVWRHCWGCLRSPYWKWVFWWGGRGSSALVCRGTVTCGNAPCRVSGSASSVSLNLLQTNQTGQSRVVNPSVAMLEKGRASPPRRRVIMSCSATATDWRNGCQQPGWCPQIGISALPGDSWGTFLRSSQCLLSVQHPTFQPKTSFGIWDGWDSPGLVLPSVWGMLSPSCSSARYILVSHGRLTSCAAASGIKNRTDKDCDPTPSPACWQSRCCSTPWRGFSRLSFCRARWQILFSGYFCCSVFEKPTCYEVGNIHQPVENLWRAQSGVLSPCWQEKWVLDSWNCSLGELVCWEVARPEPFSCVRCSVLLAPEAAAVSRLKWCRIIRIPVFLVLEPIVLFNLGG